MGNWSSGCAAGSAGRQNLLGAGLDASPKVWQKHSFDAFSTVEQL